MSATTPSMTDTPGAAFETVARQTSRVRAMAWNAALLVVFALALEVTTRVDEWVRFRTPFFTRAISDDHLIDPNGVHGRPHAHYSRWAMNSLGMQGPEVSVAKPADTLRVVTIGASETAGFAESVGFDYPRQIERRLQAGLGNICADGRPRRIELLNAALPGMSLPTQTRDVLTRLRRLEVDAVVVYPTPVQYLTPSPPQATVSRPALRRDFPFTNALRPRVSLRLREQAKLLTPGVVKRWYWRRHVDNVARTHPPGWRFTTPPPERLAMFERDLHALVAAIRSIGAVPVLGTHANVFMRPGPHDPNLLVQLEHFYARATAATIVAFDDAARQATVRVAEATGVTLVDVAQRLSTAEGTLFSDAVHFTDRGAALVAEAFAAGLLSAVPQRCARPVPSHR